MIQIESLQTEKGVLESVLDHKNPLANENDHQESRIHDTINLNSRYLRITLLRRQAKDGLINDQCLYQKVHDGILL